MPSPNSPAPLDSGNTSSKPSGPTRRPVESGAEAPHSKRDASLLDCGDASPLATASLGSPPTTPSSKDWPHAPVHRLSERGTYMVTAGTMAKARLLHDPARLSLVRDTLFAVAKEFEWELQAWAVLSNHYHFVAHSPDAASTLRRLIAKLHMTTAKTLNLMDGTPRRRVWFQYRDTRLTFETSLFARLRYVHDNPVHHGVVRHSADYPWCSAAWWKHHASPAAREMLASFKVDRLNVPDDY